MILIIGGAYQGKKEYLEEILGIPREEMYVCRRFRTGAEDPESLEQESVETQIDEELDYMLSPEAEAICDLDKWVRNMLAAGRDPERFLWDHFEALSDKYISITDVSQGIVPIKKEDRIFRETNSRIMTWLADYADEVYRIFCGIPQRIK